MNTITTSSGVTVEIIDMSPLKKEGFISMFGDSKTPYKADATHGQANVALGEFVTPDEALNAVTAYGATVCHWFIRGKQVK